MPSPHAIQAVNEAIAGRPALQSIAKLLESYWDNPATELVRSLTNEHRHAVWLERYLTWERRIRKLVHGDLGRIESARPKTFRVVREGRGTEELHRAVLAQAIESLANRIGILQSAMNPIRGEAIDWSRISEPSVEMMRSEMRGFVESLSSSLDTIRTKINAVHDQAPQLGLEDLATAHDLLADYLYDAEVATVFAQRAKTLIDSARTQAP